MAHEKNRVLRLKTRPDWLLPIYPRSGNVFVVPFGQANGHTEDVLQSPSGELFQVFDALIFKRIRSPAHDAMLVLVVVLVLLVRLGWGIERKIRGLDVNFDPLLMWIVPEVLIANPALDLRVACSHHGQPEDEAERAMRLPQGSQTKRLEPDKQTKMCQGYEIYGNESSNT